MLNKKHFLSSRVRLFSVATSDLEVAVMPDMPSAYVISLLVKKLHFPVKNIALNPIYSSKSYYEWICEHINDFEEEYYVFFLEHYHHSSIYAKNFLEKILPNIPNKRVIVQSFRMDNNEATRLMEDFPGIDVIVRTDIEFFLDQWLYHSTKPEDIPNIVYRNQENAIIASSQEDVEYDLNEYIPETYNREVFELQKHPGYMLSFYPGDNKESQLARSCVQSQIAKWQVMLMTGRWCKYKCFYCSRSVKYSVVRTISLETIKHDLDFLSSIGTKAILFGDDCFVTTNHNRFEELVALLNSYDFVYSFAMRYEICTVAKNMELLSTMKIDRIQMGVQSIHKDTNGIVARNFQQARFGDIIQTLRSQWIRISLDIILGLPGENFYDFIQTFAYVVSLAPSQICVNRLHVNPWTRLHEQKEEFGVITTPDGLFSTGTIISSNSFTSNDIIRAENYIKDYARKPNSVRVNLR